MTLPAPLLPPTVDLRKFPDLPIDVARLQKSETLRRVKPEEFRAAVRLWAAAWHETPAASLPDDDVTLADLAGFGNQVKAWKKVRAGALRGFVLCSDGRLYHPVIVEKAIKAWRSQLESRWKTECNRIKKAQQRKNETVDTPEFDLWIITGCPEAAPYMSLGTKEAGPEDKPRQSLGTPPPCPEKSASNRTEQNRTQDISDNRFPGGGDTEDPRPPEAAVEPHPNPALLARIVAECQRAHLEAAVPENAILARWARNGATVTQVTNALAQARSPGSKPLPELLRAGYVDAILVKIMAADAEVRGAAEARIKRTAEQNAALREAAKNAAPMPEHLKPRGKRAAA